MFKYIKQYSFLTVETKKIKTKVTTLIIFAKLIKNDLYFVYQTVTTKLTMII